MKKIKVVIVDDSSFVRVFLKKILSEDRDIQVVGTASDPYQAVEEIKSKNPDLLTLDVELPGMNGLEFLKKLMTAHPMPVIMISTLTTSRSKVTLKALELGAFDFIAKPNLSNQRNLLDFKREVLSKIKTVEKVKMKNILDTVRLRSISEVSHSGKINNLNRNIIGIGVSTGGVQTLKKLLPSFPSNIPGMLIVQHMPREFTLSFARMLNNVSGIEIKEAESGDEVLGGRALLAPGDSHLELQKIKNRYFVKLNRREKVNHQRPSVDVTFNSLAEVAGSKTIGVLLTGMGTDGARGMLNIKKAGGYTIAQNEETAIVYGMPRAAVELNAANEILPLAEISEKIEKLINEVK